MIWTTWRRHRFGILALMLIWLALVTVMVVTERQYHSAAIACAHVANQLAKQSACRSAQSRWQTRDQTFVLGLMMWPILIGLIVGAPLVASEIERRTNRLAWSQGVTRSRWLLVSWSTLAVPAAVATALLQLVVQWWATHVYLVPMAGVTTTIPTDLTGVSPVAIALFALSFGTWIGALLRNVSIAAGGALLLPLFAFGVISTNTNTNGRYPLSQWGVAGIYLSLAATFLALSLLTVRRWRA
jgi:ABC-type transport system involved in multi-copper enzyme maturation permease subunit